MTVWSIRGALNHVDAKSFLTFYAAPVRPKLRCKIQALGPCLKESSKLSEKVQRSTPTLFIGIAISCIMTVRVSLTYLFCHSERS